MGDISGKDFERRVGETYEALDYQVTYNSDLAGKQTDLVVEKRIPGASAIILAVECKDHDRPIGNDPVHTFISRIVSQSAAGKITGGVLVSRNGFTAKARAAAVDHHDITLLSLDELASQIFDISLPLRELVEHYEEQEIFRDYMPLKVEAQQWSTATKAAQPQTFDELMSQMVRFNGSRGIGVMLVLADFGAGKTTLLRNIEYHRAKAHLTGEDTRVPLFVPLRDFRDSHDVGVLLQGSFREAYYRDLPLGVLWQRIESGSFYLLLDGFDEMVDRSDSPRRLELFQALVPLLRSRSPVLLTSRPSYLVERGELESLLSSLQNEPEAGPTPVAGGTHSKVVAEQLRQQIFESMQDDGTRRGVNLMLNPHQVRIVRLKSLESVQVEAFVASHADDLAQVEASASDLLAFIDRTYDLTDLATRPMLLRLIVNTVVIGGIDLSDTSAQYGASSLYEMYTHAKLDFDVKKIRGTNTGLGVGTRRRLAESLALEMYRAKTLEADFHAHLRTIATNNRSLGSALSSSGLSEAEIATDLAARSFVTLDQEGICRFIHKSFRGFFVARHLKEQLPELSAMFDEYLEDEVLYFLGGFAPTEKHVGRALWESYLKTDPGDRVRRRNLIVAFLHTKPRHDRRIEDVDILEAEFGRLQFADSKSRDVRWQDVTVRKFEMVKTTWKNVSLRGSRFDNALVEGGDLDLKLSGSSFESWSCVDTNGSIEGSESTIDRWLVERSSINCKARDGLVVKELSLSGARFVLRDPDEDMLSPALVGKVTMSKSHLMVLGTAKPAELEAADSVIVCGSAKLISKDWTARKSVLYLVHGPVKRRNREVDSDPPPSVDSSSIVLAPDGITLPLLNSFGGVFGSVWPADDEIPLLTGAQAWGVLEADDLLRTIQLPKRHAGCKLGSLFLVRSKKYEALASGELSALTQLEKLVSGSGIDPTNPGSFKQVDHLRRSTRVQFEALTQPSWPTFEECLAKEK